MGRDGEEGEEVNKLIWDDELQRGMCQRKVKEEKQSD